MSDKKRTDVENEAIERINAASVPSQPGDDFVVCQADAVKIVRESLARLREDTNDGLTREQADAKFEVQIRYDERQKVLKELRSEKAEEQLRRFRILHERDCDCPNCIRVLEALAMARAQEYQRIREFFDALPWESGFRETLEKIAWARLEKP